MARMVQPAGKVGGAKKKPVPSAKRTGSFPVPKKVKVSQSTIDTIKKQGMTAAIKKAAAGGVSKEYMEGVKRMYGAKRLAAATGAAVKKRQTPTMKTSPKKFGASGSSK